MVSISKTMKTAYPTSRIGSCKSCGLPWATKWCISCGQHFTRQTQLVLQVVSLSLELLQGLSQLELKIRDHIIREYSFLAFDLLYRQFYSIPSSLNRDLPLSFSSHETDCRFSFLQWCILAGLQMFLHFYSIIRVFSYMGLEKLIKPQVPIVVFLPLWKSMRTQPNTYMIHHFWFVKRSRLVWYESYQIVEFCRGVSSKSPCFKYEKGSI